MCAGYAGYAGARAAQRPPAAGEVAEARAVVDTAGDMAGLRRTAMGNGGGEAHAGRPPHSCARRSQLRLCLVLRRGRAPARTQTTQTCQARNCGRAPP